MDRPTTLAILCAALALAGIGWVGDRQRSRQPLGGWALGPWHALIFAGLTVALFMLVHLVTLLGEP